ncbi:protein mitoshell isoform X2 [Drosophila willistoni]|uniref:protein mitoshell isoform X2 n=1 Tax=Drosophila willistoni TaxID=7260 RepID=UPI000C26C4D3|nr:protein mitoshell isoform X2 [Drosophila willistoni]
MNGIPVFQLPTVATQSMRQQSMYQQTYLDRNRMVTDVIVQEHVSQSSWSMGPLATVFVPGGGSGGTGPPPSQTGPGYMTYVPMPGAQYYAASSASMNSYGQGQIYSSRSSSCNMTGFMPSNYQPPYQGPPPKQYTATQTQTSVKRICDAATQVDFPPKELPSIKPTTQMNSSGYNMSFQNADESSQNYVQCGGGDGPHASAINQGLRRNSEVILLPQRLHDITRISLQGSEIAERLANAHCNRPCFKKIDTLCARLKQDLLRPDGVLPNINSQGIAWAVKDFIFVFTRIVNAWVILKGYVYNTPEGLNKIKDELPRGFMTTFDCWQLGTLSLVEMIIKSFVNLDDLLQKQKNCFGNTMASNNTLKTHNNDSSECNVGVGSVGPLTSMNYGQGPSAFSTPQNTNVTEKFTDTCDLTSVEPKCTLNLNYLYTMVEDSEETQRNVDANGTYLRTGTYQPLQKDQKKDASNIDYLAETSQWKSATIPPQPGNPRVNQLRKQSTSSSELDSPLKPFLNPLSQVDQEVVRTLYDFSDRVMELQFIDRFFQKQFTSNYFPEFYQQCQHDFIDVRDIVLKCESVSYQHVYQAVHDMRRISFVGRCFLQFYTDDDLKHYLYLYEQSIDTMLTEPPNLPNQYDHIIGKPGEKLFIYNI